MNTQTALLGIREGAPSPVVRLVLHAYDDRRVFAGVRTALHAGTRLARELRRPLRIVLLTEGPEGSVGALIDLLSRDAGASDLGGVGVADLRRDPDERSHPDDVWIATYWTTAVAAGVACRAGILDPGRVVYLVQDYEAGFFGWSDESVAAAATYQAGFHLLVNSRPLARYLHDQLGLTIPDEQVFAPVVDATALVRAAEGWRPDPDGQLRVLFYGRPSHPRNLFRIGLQSLQVWLEALDDRDLPVLRSAGADHPPYLVGGAGRIEPIGRVSLETYYDLLSRTDLTLALMYSPHPSHLSLEPPMAGVPTVTNTFGTYREPWMAGLHLADPEPAALAEALGVAAAEARALELHRPQAMPAALGGSLDAAISVLATRF